MINHLKKYAKNFNLNNNNFLNISPKIFTFIEISDFLLKKKYPYYFYKNEKFTNFFWTEYRLIFLNKKYDDKKFISKVKKYFGPKNFLELVTIYSALLIIGKFSMALKVRVLLEKIVKKKKFVIKSNYIKKILDPVNSLNIKKSFKFKKKDFIDKRTNIFQEEYKKYLEKKSVAVVGVLETRLKNGKDIEKKDVVVKLNYISNKNYSNKLTQSSRCEVSYLNDHTVNNRISLLKKNYKPKFVVIKNTAKKKLKNIPKTNQVISNQHDIYILGTPSLLIRTILDLMKYNLSEIKIFNSSIYLPINKKVKRQNLKHSPKLLLLKKKYKIHATASAFVIHDIVSEFLIMQKLVKNNLIKVDKNLQRVLNLGLNLYLQKMEKFYKKSIRIMLLNKF